MDFLGVDVELLLVSVAVVKDTLKCDDWMLSDLNVNVNEFMETNTIFLQFNAKSPTRDTVSTSTPSKSILDVLMNKKTVFLNLSKMQLLGQHGNIVLL